MSAPASLPRYTCVTNPDCPGYHASKHEVCDETVELARRLAHIEHDMSLQGKVLYASTIREAARRIKRLEGGDALTAASDNVHMWRLGEAAREARAMTPLEATLNLLARMSDFERWKFFEGLRAVYCAECGSDAGRRCVCMRDE